MLGTKTDVETENIIVGIITTLEHLHTDTYFIRIYNQDTTILYSYDATTQLRSLKMA
jgi:hypothetical protein